MFVFTLVFYNQNYNQGVSMNGSQLTLLGGIISDAGVGLSLWGSYKSSKTDGR